MEGILFKRQRGLKSVSKKLKFQERFCRLTSTSLDYYDPKKKTVRSPGSILWLQKCPLCIRSAISVAVGCNYCMLPPIDFNGLAMVLFIVGRPTPCMPAPAVKTLKQLC